MKPLSVVVVVCVLAAPAFGQTAAPTPTPFPQRDPKALSLLTQSLTAMIKNRPIQDIRLTADVSRTAGAETNSGTATIEGAAYDQSRHTYAFTSGLGTEIRNGSAGVWSGPDAQNHAMALHNTWTAAPWFAPSLVVQSWVQDPTFSLAYVGQESLNGSHVQHIRAAHYPAMAGVPGIAAEIARLSTVEIYIDAQSFLPVELTFDTHPDSDLSVNLPIRVTFADYRTFAGLVAPARIQKFLQGSLLLDISVNATTANNGLGSSEFQLP
jgi:hypothetical protein